MSCFWTSINLRQISVSGISKPDSEIVMVDLAFGDDLFEQDRSWGDFGKIIVSASRSPPGRGHHFCENSGPLLTPFFVLWDHFWRTWGTLLPLKIKKSHPGQPIVIFPDITSHFGSHCEVSFFNIFSKSEYFRGVFFDVVSHSLF